MFQIIEYLKFLWKSKNQHGVHSPFVYNLITQCFYDGTIYSDYQAIKRYRNALINDSDVIKITDFGAGSRTTSKRTRSVKSITKSAGSTKCQAKLLYRLVTYFKPKTILELGTSLGLGTYTMHLANPEANIITVEGCENLSGYTAKQFASKDHNVTFRTGSFAENLSELKAEAWDLVFFDGDHTKRGTLTYFNELVGTAKNDTIFIFDDIHWSAEMVEAWEEIKEHPKVTVTLDIFYKGLVFFRQEQQKEHFLIRV